MPAITENQSNTHLFHVAACKALDDKTLTLTLTVPGGNVTLNFDSSTKMRHVAAVILAAMPTEDTVKEVVVVVDDDEDDDDQADKESSDEDSASNSDSGESEGGEESDYDSIGDVGLTQEIAFCSSRL